MGTIEKFEMICSIINDMSIEQLKSMDFKSLCKEKELDFLEIDNCFYSNLGMSADEYARHIASEWRAVL